MMVLRILPVVNGFETYPNGQDAPVGLGSNSGHRCSIAEVVTKRAFPTSHAIILSSASLTS